MAKWWLLSTLLILGLAAQSAAEEFEYVLLFLYNDAVEDKNVELYVSSRDPSSHVNVTITNPNGDEFANPISMTLAPFTVEMYQLTPSVRQESDFGNNAIKVVADADIIVYGLNRNLYSTDGLTAFSVDNVGKEYYAFAYGNENTQIGLVAVEDGQTVVNVTVPPATVVLWQGVTYNTGDIIRVLLVRKYQSARLSASIGDLTGARIVATQKISVFSGNVRTRVDGESSDHLVDQLPPVVQWGFNYFTVRTPARTPDRPDIVRVVAHEDNTEVQVKGGLVQSFQLNSGEFRELSTFAPLHVNSGDKSVMVGVVCTSQSKEAQYEDIDEGDPSLVIIPAVGQYSADYIFATPQYIKPPSSSSSQYDIYVLVIVNTTEKDDLSLNGVLVNTSSWQVIAGTTYSTGQISVANGATYRLRHSNDDARFLALLYGSADRESFYFPIDVGMDNIYVTKPVEIEGNQGEEGEKGSVGIIGATGTTGVRGPQGEIGATGAQGPAGEKGDKGAAGSPSSIGSTGATGAAGVAGVKGAPGTAGATGATGSTGATGMIGLPGASGARGQAGGVGEPGSPGDDGDQGNYGFPGVDGDKGEKGAEGPPGAPGINGIKGAQGSVVVGSCVNKCTTRASVQPTTCRVTYGEYSHLCSCPPGFYLSKADPSTCIDIDECGQELCSHGCENTIGSYMCNCPSGYQLIGDTCIDIDECANSSKPCGAYICVNGIGSFLCLSSSAPPPVTSARGLNALINRDLFLALLSLIVLLTFLAIILAFCLFVRHRTRQRKQKPSVDYVSENVTYYDGPPIILTPTYK